LFAAVGGFDSGMRVTQTGAETTSMSRRPLQPKTQYTEASFRANKVNDYSGDVGLSSANMRDSGSGSYSLVRHNSVVFEHDFDTNRRSRVHSVSEVTEEMQLGLNHGTRDHVEDGYRSDGKPGKGSKTQGLPGGLVRQVSHESHQFSQETYSSSPSPGKKKGQINSFVYKNYALLDRRTLSLPIGKEYSVSEYVGQSTEVQSHGDSNSRNVTISELKWNR
jgi:hypothetical protein